MKSENNREFFTKLNMSILDTCISRKPSPEYMTNFISSALAIQFAICDFEEENIKEFFKTILDVYKKTKKEIK